MSVESQPTTGTGLLGGLVERLDHVAVAVHDLAAPCTLFLDVLGGVLIAGGDDEELGIRTVQVRFPPGSKVELLQPLDENSYLSAYLAKHGPGFHHLTCFVADVEDAARTLEDAGFHTVDTRSGTNFWDETYIRPSSGFGTLIQLASSPLSWSEPCMPEGATVADVLAGRIAWNQARPQWKEGSGW
ncbi:VOC family protein [Saccharomonospora azurea]|uniref:VOC family protein n=1 Tax=Saccharomonospora azurea TaxID=40988 RepID=UPI00023FEB0A|nr:VOC family protein [Saccharomonospora azurea]EHK82451.1 Glyoxalase/bleomycin resistance protein/dioxygenase [Saccharomonospora azurea SZMC 14600]